MDHKTEKPVKKTRRKESKSQPKSALGGVLALLTLIAIIGAIIMSSMSSMGAVAGVATKKTPPKSTVTTEDISEQVMESAEKRLTNIQEQVANLDPADLVTSSPQLDKLISDLEGLRNAPQNQYEKVCQAVCGGI